ncbi:TGF-beta-activated kinase 1 and MAP3K7-binding protein 1 [Frankliniella fusca]|uniref:TGF-beta-activated kinase 1 and MAP3K7-binding protein 1 n=1 Tax=Frankliniella fusca TaxID=407009 RepID=A0AAE1H533_9NEOP|nr:TGF-beta-activated kinase 1 and MAP3K7-binding protein 1 [Frankliniella fusca]
MPTRAEVPSSSHKPYDNLWTDHLPVCRLSGVGSSTNQLYREDGIRQEEHPCEDRSFHIRVNNDIHLYGVFDGHEGAETAQFALQRMVFEILFGQLEGKTSDEEIKEVLRQAFLSVEKSYMQSIDDRLAERAKLQMDIPENLSEYEVFKKYPHLVERLKILNGEISCGTTAVVALIIKGRLFVANVGECRALLCKSDPDGVLRVLQLSVDHNLYNEDELLRLQQLGLDINHRLGNQETSRCIGNYLVKGGYKEISELASSLSEPVIAEPEVHGGIPIDESCRFLMLMSDGVYKSLESATRTDQVNKELAQLAVGEFRTQSTLTGVAQAVVDRIGRIHHDVFMSNNLSREIDSAPSGGPKGRRDDMTLLIRNFNFEIPNALPGQSPSIQPSLSPLIFPIESENSSGRSPTSGGSTLTKSDTEVTNTSYETMPQTDDTFDTGRSTSDGISQPINTTPAAIPAYVDFSEYYANVERARIAGTLPDGIDF